MNRRETRLPQGRLLHKYRQVPMQAVNLNWRMSGELSIRRQQHPARAIDADMAGLDRGDLLKLNMTAAVYRGKQFQQA